MNTWYHLFVIWWVIFKNLKFEISCFQNFKIIIEKFEDRQE